MHNSDESDQFTSLPLCSREFDTDGRRHTRHDLVEASLDKSIIGASHGTIGGSKSGQLGSLSLFQGFATACFLSAYNVNAFPVAYAAEGSRNLLRNLNTSLSFDPVSLITLFFDAAEKQLMERSGDLTFLSFCGLFVNPTTLWWEYGTLHPGSGLQYYVPNMMLTSTVEVAQVNNFLITLARGRRNCGILVHLGHSSTTSSWEWKLRPILPIILAVFIALDRDVWGLGALACLFFGQAIVIVKGMHDGRKQKHERGHTASAVGSKQVPESNIGEESEPETHRTDAKSVSCIPRATESTKTAQSVVHDQATVLFLANNVTVVIKCKDQLFVKASAAIHFEKFERPAALEVLTIMIFMAGVLMVGFAGMNFKIVYLVGHAVQAVVIALGNASRFKARHVNGVTWSIVDDKEHLGRRRDAYRWATEHAGGSVGWLTKFSLASDSLASEIKTALAKGKDQK